MGILPQDEQAFKFQGDKNAGYDVLLTNMKQAATTSKEFHEILRERVNYEEIFLNRFRDCLQKHEQLSQLGRFFVIVTISQIRIEKKNFNVLLNSCPYSR